MSSFPVTLAAKSYYRLGEPITVTFGLRNATTVDYSILEWNTPLERLDQEALEYLRVEHGNQALPYDGRVFKRANPDQSSYRLVRSGQSVTEQVDLSTAFAFTEPGWYTVTLNTRIDDAIARVGGAPSTRTHTQFAGVDLDNASVHFQILPGGQARSTIAERLRANRAAVDDPPGDDTPPEHITFTGASAAQQTTIKRAAHDAVNYITTASNYLNATTSARPRYVTWFGAYTQARHDQVQSHFALMNKDPLYTNYDASTCTAPNVYAYVYPNNADVIYLCPAFWKAPAKGTDSQAGTVVHEESHFTINGGTRDYAYGQPACKNLARSDPGKAVMNADSHEYFAENNPPMG